MADAHVGKGMPIGGVVALENAICPAAVGVDIGCGMVAVKTTLSAELIVEHAVPLQRAIKKVIPIGEGQGRSGNDHVQGRGPLNEIGQAVNYPVVNESVMVLPKTASLIKKVWVSQLGSLGGGNHFLEFDVDEDGNVWVVIHSGSRRAGKEVAEHYIPLAHKLCTKWGVPVGKNFATLPVDSTEGRQYLAAMDLMLRYAYANRMIMMQDTLDVLVRFFGRFDREDAINVHHNYAALENHFGRNVWVHRKGATRARKDEMLIIPGNMGDGTAICRGLGNPDSFCTSSHGAGRAMGRGDARRNLDEAAERKYLADHGVQVCAGRDGFLEEAPSAYKNFDTVLSNQADLIEVVHRLHPLLVLKG
jgi:tRNA-splicing ligase RtcB